MTLAKVIRLSDYRRGLRLEGRVLTYRGRAQALRLCQARALAECIHESLGRQGQWAAAGFVLRREGRRFRISSVPLGQIELTRSEVTRLGFGLATISVATNETPKGATSP